MDPRSRHKRTRRWGTRVGWAMASVIAVLGCQMGSTASAKMKKTLPDYMAVKRYNPKIAGYKRISHWAQGMGYHMGQLAPSLVLMINNHSEVVGMEQMFPTTLPYHRWMDPQTKEFNAGRGAYSQHLMFVPPFKITPNMKDDLPSALASFDAFKRVNGGRVVPYSQITPFTPGKGAMWGPDGPALRVLLNRSEHVVGGMMAVPAAYGWEPWFDQPKGSPTDDPVLGMVYTQTIFFTPRSSIV